METFKELIVHKMGNYIRIDEQQCDLYGSAMSFNTLCIYKFKDIFVIY